MSICEDVIEEARRLVQAGAARGLTLRLLGGLAIREHSPSATHRTLARAYPDIDFVVPAKAKAAIEGFMTAEGYTPNKTFNTLSGDHRQLYYDMERNRQVDVFVGSFEMCHKLPLADRLDAEPLTVPLAELFLSKAQIVTLNRKDVLDLIVLLLDHQVGTGDQETINQAVIADLCGKDWGLYTTVTVNMEKLNTILAKGEVELDDARKSAVNRQLAALKAAMDGAPKTLAWKMRAKVGTRVRWYEEVEEVQR